MQLNDASFNRRETTAVLKSLPDSICDHAAFAQTGKSSTDKRSEIAGFAAKAH